MLSAFRIAAARQLRVLDALSAKGVSSLASRMSGNQAHAAVPVFYSIPANRREFSANTAQGETATKTTTTKAKKSSGGATPKKARRVASPEERQAAKEVRDQKKRKALIRELKETALLTEPAKLPTRSWVVFFSEHVRGTKLSSSNMATRASELSEAYKSLSASEMERLQTVARQNLKANNVAYKTWVESHTPEQISEANKARQRLKRVFKTTAKGPIEDERQPKRPTTAFSLFAKSRWGSGEFTGVKIAEASKAMSSEWKALSDAERQQFIDEAKADLERYVRDKKDILNEDVLPRKKSS